MAPSIHRDTRPHQSGLGDAERDRPRGCRPGRPPAVRFKPCDPTAFNVPIPLQFHPKAEASIEARSSLLVLPAPQEADRRCTADQP